jgi:hypothetical protein
VDAVESGVSLSFTSVFSAAALFFAVIRVLGCGT